MKTTLQTVTQEFTPKVSPIKVGVLYSGVQTGDTYYIKSMSITECEPTIGDS